jgi:hypothetical protein
MTLRNILESAGMGERYKHSHIRVLAKTGASIVLWLRVRVATHAGERSCIVALSAQCRSLGGADLSLSYAAPCFLSSSYSALPYRPNDDHWAAPIPYCACFSSSSL